MQSRKWNSLDNFKIVLEGLKGRSVADICNDHQIRQSQYYKWRDQFFANGKKAFEIAHQSALETRQAKQIEKLKAVVGELTIELIPQGD